MTVAAAAETTPSEDGRTRQRVLGYVLDQGPVSASALAKTMDLTAAAVRRHLDALEADGLIEVRALTGQKAGRGRPARQYTVTPEGHSQISHTYDELALDLLTFMRETGGEEAVGSFARSHADKLRERLRRRLEDFRPGEAPRGTVAERSRRLARALAAEGFAASSTPVAAGTPLEALQLCQGHCPIQHVAERFPEFCEAELEVISEYLAVDVRRLSTLAGGGHVCTTHIPTSALARPLLGGPAPDHNQGGSR
ncbi:helix-turn-helix transcriptional regulator [Brevibacterium album]|uniref:helix-turn-helix transcriptional regulator n=1 Tax=Brevibacterium album TaxID=417948 RepID=UPI001FDF5772|nr:metalloregulator ArsR/SmtB family transcription factor [Brevibacterium album]